MADIELPPLPCPFCGVGLVANDCPDDLYVRRYGRHWMHPDDTCIMSGEEVSPTKKVDWNTRATAQPIAERCAELERSYENCKLQAQCWAQEARAANSTIADIYAACGQPSAGNWNGAEPVRARIAALEAELAAEKASDAESIRMYRAARDRAEALEAELAGLRALLDSAMGYAKHGDNCFLRDDGGEYDACFCGLDSLRAAIDAAADQAEIAGMDGGKT